MSTKPTDIEIGCETWEYEIEGHYTHIRDGDGEPVVTLRWAATEGEVKAAAYGFGAGRLIGEKCGIAKQQAAILQALGIPYHLKS